ncbi:hypothetical protein [Sphingomonas albertensis]|uniref:Uncharacterized protein n=1 Tax=Sphingomonas albertensis TaxID=2762591 RepID=A0ABR7AL60_9SPHN|nr:hypothetical protein [Sphingomonas albertensis]MBC3941206.1 hypothetical protein [Sphingomonas albertensis]
MCITDADGSALCRVSLPGAARRVQEDMAQVGQCRPMSANTGTPPPQITPGDYAP